MSIFDLGFEPVIASGIEIGLLAVGIALSAAAGLLLTPSANRNPVVRKNSSPVLAERGAFIPYLIGTFRLGCVFAWSGKPRTKTIESGGTFGYGTTKTNVTSQAGWHIICIGPVARLVKIYEQGKVIYPVAGEQPLTNSAFGGGTSDGASIKCKSGRGTFRIYWGNPAGPIDGLLAGTGSKYNIASGMGVASRFPNVCYIVWDRKKLSAPNQWPEMNYEVEVRPKDTSGLSGTAWNDGTALVTGSPFRKDNGANPIHALAQIMLGTFPHGVGIPSGNLDLSFFNAMQAICTTEGLVSNVLCQDGNKASELANDILQDIGAVTPQVGDKIIVLLIRKETSPPTLTTDALVPPLPEKVFVQGDLPSNRNTYVYKDRQLAYRDNDVTIDDDSVQLGRSKSVQVPLNSIVDLNIANKIIDRKQMENLIAVKTFTVTAGRQGRALSPGQVFVTSDLGRVRIVSVERPDQSSTIKMECVADIFSPVSGGGGVSARELVNDVVKSVYPDAQLFMWVVPYDLMPQGANFVDAWVQFFPIRANDYISGQNIYGTFDTGGSPVYNLLATNNAFFVQGLLTTEVRTGVYWDFTLPISSETAQIEINIESFTMTDETGTAIASSDLDFDIGLFPDLTNYPERWRNGENCCAIESSLLTEGFVEVFYFKSITVSPNDHCYYLNGVLRNRMIKKLNPNQQYSGRVMLFRRLDLSPVLIPNPTTGATWSPTNVFKGKTNAIGVNGDVNEIPGNGIITSKVKASFEPLAPANFRSSDADLGFNRFSWGAGSNFIFKWTNRPLIQGVGASCGTQLAGVSISPVPIPFEGVLTIKIYPDKTNADALSGLKRTFNVVAGNRQIYTTLQLNADFGVIVGFGLSTFYATYQVNVNGVTSPLFGQLFQTR